MNGKNLTVADLFAFVHNPSVKIELDPKALMGARASFSFLSESIKEKVIYGVNTGFGPMASHLIGIKELVGLQKNLIRSHATGIGEYVNSALVLSAMVVRLNTLLRGYSGVSEELLDRLKQFIDYRIIPCVPEHGAVGASGDLVQLAHIALAIGGEGKVLYQGKEETATHVLKKLGIPSYVFKPKEGLAMINGTSMMAGIAALLCREAENIMEVAIKQGAFALELVHGFSDAISEDLQNVRPHEGQKIVAQKLRASLASSRLLRDRDIFQDRVKPENENEVKKIHEGVQEIYSFRCLPQILGPIFETIAKARQVVEIEINSVTDNPIIDVRRKKFLHGGNFHGDYISFSMDQLKISLIKLILLTERRINFFLNQNINKYFPPFLNLHKPGLSLGLQGLQFVATSTAAQSQTLGFPHYLHSISTNADNQDVVSMGTDSALLTAKVVENAYILLGIELVVLLQATDATKEVDKLSLSSRNIFREGRAIVPVVIEDRSLAEELENLIKLLKK